MAQPTSNVNNFFGQKVSQPGIPVNQANDSQLLYKNDFSTQTFYDQFGNARVIFGLLPDGNYGLIVSLPNQDAATSNNLAFSSEQITGVIIYPSVNLNNSSQNFDSTIPHNLGYVPNFSVIAAVPSAGTPFSVPGTYVYANISGSLGNAALSGSDASGTIYNYEVAIDQTNLYTQLSVFNGGVTATLPIQLQYYIIKQQIVS